MTTTAWTDLNGVAAPTRPAARDALAGVAIAVDQLLAADLTLPGDTDILDLLRDVETATRRLHTASLAVIHQITARGLAAPAGASSTATLLRQLLPLTAGDAHQRVRLAAATCPSTGLTGTPLPPALPILAAALQAGTVGAANAATIVSTLNGFPTDVPPDVRESVEDFLVEQGAVLDPKTLHNLARRIALMANPDGPYDERDAADKQQFHIGTRRDDGLTRCWGLLDDLTVEALRAALGALCSPAANRNRPDLDPTPASATATEPADHRDTATAHPPATAEPPADDLPTDQPQAAQAAARSQSPTDDRPGPGGQPAPRPPWRPSRPPYEWAPLGTLPGDYQLPEPPDQPPPDQPPTPEDRRSAATRRAHALATIVTVFLATGAAPTIHGEKPHLLVTISETDLRRGTGSAQLGYGDTIPIVAARMLACDASVIPAVLRGPSEIIDVGRAMRTFTAAGRKAILLRDVGCVFPGCPMPGAWCDNHHIQHWANGGPSNPRQRRSTVPPASHPDPSWSLADPPRPRPHPGNHPAHHPRPGTTTATQHPPPATHLHLAQPARGRLTPVATALATGNDGNGAGR